MNIDDDRAGFVRVSRRHQRYFELSDGRPFVPIGLNLIGPSDEGGLAELEAWLARLHENGGNFCRLWLSHPFFDVEHARSGEYDPARWARIDDAVALARRFGIRVKLCLEHFRHVGDAPRIVYPKPLHHTSEGGPATTTAEWFDSEICRQQFKQKLACYAARYGGDPIVFGWELWNEIDCIAGGDWYQWTSEMLGELHRLCPDHLAMQSLGSFDKESRREPYVRLGRLSGSNVAQVHRYLDPGASLDICRAPLDLLAADAVGELLRIAPTKPVLLAECGAVEPNHSGPSALYPADREGVILHDLLFATFFGGAAGPGHIWHCETYVDRMNLWFHFGRFGRALDGVDPIAERFEPIVMAHPTLRILALEGRRMLLAWCRDSNTTWRTELEAGRPPEPVRGAVVALTGAVARFGNATVSVYDPWFDRWLPATVRQCVITLPEFVRSLVVRLESVDERSNPTATA